MPSRCIFFFSALRAWSTLLSRTRTCTRAPLQSVRGICWRRERERLRHLAAACSRTAPEKLAGKHSGDVAHFAARAHHGLAVKVHRGAGNGEETPVILDFAADEVRHLDAAVANRLGQRPSGYRPDVLLEL